MAPPPPTSDSHLLREHKFYETGNMKYALPFFNQNYSYETNDGDDMTDFIIKFVIIMMIVLCLNSKMVRSLFKGRTTKEVESTREVDASLV